MSNDEVRFFGCAPSFAKATEGAGRGGKLDYEGDEQEEHADYDGGEGDF